MKTFILLLVVFLMLLTGCESPSRRVATQQNLEKVVILDREIIGYGDSNQYKVKRLSTKTVCFINITKKYYYDVNDTILWSFSTQYTKR